MSKEKKTKETSVVALANLTQENIPELIQKVKEQITLLNTKAGKVIPTTNNLTGYGQIESISTVENLIMAHASVVERSDAYDRSAKAIIPEGIKVPIFIMDGQTKEEWVSHIKSRVFDVANEKKLEKLKSMLTKLESNLSAKDKLAKDLAEINEDLESGL